MSTTDPPADNTAAPEYEEEKTLPSAETEAALKTLSGSQETEPDDSVPPTEWELTRKHLKEHPHDVEQWRRLVDLAESSGETDRVKEAYEALLERYPNTSAAQIAYINHYLNASQFMFAEALFKRFIPSSSSVDLWRFYLTYIRRVNTGNTPQSRENIRQSYEYTLKNVGHDKDSGPIWADYIQFLKSGETSTTWEEQQKMDALRKVYARAVQVPHEQLESLWSDYEAFETSLNRITAKKFMQDLNPPYMQARTVLRTLLKHLGPLFPPQPGDSPSRAMYLPPQPTFSPAERALVGAWKAYLKWEEGNPLELDEKDRPVLIARVQGVYRKAVVRMRYYGEIWYMAYVWTNGVGKHNEALTILRAGIEANPTSFVLNFAYAEALEARAIESTEKNLDAQAKEEYAEVHALYDRFLASLRTELDTLEEKLSSAHSSFASDTTQPDQPNANAPALGGPGKKELDERRTEYGLVWVMYMRFGARAEGPKSARPIFGKARKDRRVPWITYEAAALMEYHTAKETAVAGRIFETGLKSFGDDVEFVLRYLGFLISVNDEQNARALFERVIGTFSPERARPLWERWARYEYQYGDLRAALKLEKRIAEVYPNDPPIKRFAQRHTYLGTDAIAARDLGVAMARQLGKSGSGTSGTGSGSSASLQPADSVQNLMASTSAANNRYNSPAPKRASSPENRPSAHKRARPMSPPPRERWEGRRPRSPDWERDRSRDRDGHRRFEKEREREEPPKPVTVPNIVSWFVGQLPTPAAFDGPIFRTEDLMTLLRGAVIPSTSRARSPPPVPPPRGGGRPPPDYGPYQGPASAPPRGRRY